MIQSEKWKLDDECVLWFNCRLFFLSFFLSVYRKLQRILVSITLYFRFFIIYIKNVWYHYKLRNDKATLYRLSQLHLILIERFTSTSRHFLLMWMHTKFPFTLVYQELMPVLLLLMLHYCLNSPASEFSKIFAKQKMDRQAAVSRSFIFLWKLCFFLLVLFLCWCLRGGLHIASLSSFILFLRSIQHVFHLCHFCYCQSLK